MASQTTDARSVALVAVGSVGLALGVLIATRSALALGLAIGVVVCVILIASFPSPASTRTLAAFLVVAPDLVRLTTVSGFPITARLAVSTLFVAATAVACVRGRLLPRFPAATLWLLILACVVARTVTLSKPSGLEQFVLFVLLPFLAAAAVGSDCAVRANFIGGIAIGSAILVLVALIELVRGQDFLANALQNSTIFVREGKVRVDAGWSYPVAFGAFFSQVLFLIFEWGSGRRLAVRFGLPALMLVGIILTQARAALLGLAAGALVYLLLQRSARDAFRVAGLLAALILLGYTLPGSIPREFRAFVSESLTSGSDANANIAYRQEIYHIGGQVIALHPYLGYGYGASENLSKPPLSDYFGGFGDLASLPISLAVDIGLIGAIAFGLAWLRSIWLAFRYRSADRGPFYRASIAALVTAAVGSIGVLGVSTLLWMVILAGLLAARPRQFDQRNVNDVSDVPPHSRSNSRFKSARVLVDSVGQGVGL